MSTVCEDSPWHREKTVAIHTNMVVGEYLAQVTTATWSKYDLYGAFVCAFHDVGKPAAREEAYKPERGVYYRYGGHELISARLWEDWAVRNWEFLVSEFDMDSQAIYRIGWLIENHLPWDTKKAAKRKSLALGVIDCASKASIFNNILRADTYGRISDDASEKRAKVEAWCDEFTKLCLSTKVDIKNTKEDLGAPIMYVPIAVSGSGKTTMFNSESMDCVRKIDGVGDNIIYYSLDALRLKWYDPDDYANAFKMACDDKQFNAKITTAFEVAVQSQRDIYLDNMNLSRKSRAKYIQKARQHGYLISAMLLPVALQTVLDRQDTRTDKTVPKGVVEDMYMRLSIPSKGEVDRIITYDGNLPKV